MLTKTQWYHLLLLAIAIAVLSTFLYQVREILPPFVIAFTVAWLLDPVLDRLQKCRCPRVVAVSAVYVVFIGLFVLGLRFLVPSVVKQAHQLPADFPTYSQAFVGRCTSMMESHRGLLTKLRLPTTPEKVIEKYGDQAEEWVTSRLKYAQKKITSGVGSFAEKVLWIILVPLLAFYLLNDIDNIRRKAVLFIPEPYRAKSTQMLARVSLVFSSYIRGLLIVCLLYGVVSTIILTAAGVRYGVIIGLLSGILYAVPFLGAILITLLVFLVALASHSLAYAAIMAGVMVVLNQVIFDSIVCPKIIGKSVGLHPVLSLFALFAGQELFGIPGMLLAVPVAASIQEIVFEFKPELRPPAKPQKSVRGRFLFRIRPTRPRSAPRGKK